MMFRDLVLQQKREFEQRQSEPYVERDGPPTTGFDSDLVQVIIGPRRAGKSFFAARRLGRLGPCGYVNFDDERLANLTEYDGLLGAVDEVYGHPQRLFFDEIQNVPRWELLVNRLQRQGRRLVITGSNSNLLSAELATHLTGRHQLMVLFPFSYREVLRLAGGELTAAEQRAWLERYAREGGFPEPWVKPLDRMDYLRTLVTAVLYKDIVKRFHIRALVGLEDLAHYLFSNVAKEFSYNTLSQVTRCRSVHTVEKYLRYLEEAFLFFTVRRFSYKVREQAAANKKIYGLDNGTAMALGFRAGSDAGRLWENLVAVALRKRELRRQAGIFFWRNAQNEEVDFVVREGLAVTRLIQVCWDVSDPKTRAREIRALLKAGAELKCPDLLVLTADVEARESVSWFGCRGVIQFQPLFQWLASQA